MLNANVNGSTADPLPGFYQNYTAYSMNGVTNTSAFSYKVLAGPANIPVSSGKLIDLEMEIELFR